MDVPTAGVRGQRSAEIAYEAIAPVYDEFTYANDYATWFDLLLPALERHGLRRGALLDVGCGSGKAFPPMLERGWRIHGCDLSPAMLELARERAGDGDVALDVADARELPTFGSFELVWALNDTVNYLLSFEELCAGLAGMRRNLAPGGLLLFDANTLAAYRTFFAEEVTIERNGMRMIWRGRSSAAAAPGSISEASFEAEPIEPGSRPSIPAELHRERHFPRAEILAALAAAGLESLDVFGFEEWALPQPLREDEHQKAIYIARAANQAASASTP